MSKAHEFTRGSVILCNDCRRPIYALERAIGPWDTAGRAARSFRPLKKSDLEGLLSERPDVPRYWQVNTLQWLATPQGRAIFDIERPTAGDLTDCPVCGGCWVHFEAREAYVSEHDRGYQLNLLDIPPLPAGTGVMTGQPKRWKDLDPVPDDLVIETRELPS